MEIQISQENSVTTLKIIGRLDTVTSPDLENAVKPYITAGASIVFDCEHMEYISSSGLRVILSTHKKLTATGGRFTVRSLNNEVRSVFDLTGFSRLLNIE